jgi:peptidoglycan/LPS O-acetylase OafA/YrhL
MEKGSVTQRKIAFADHLRGFAACIVLLYHYIVLYWTHPEIPAFFASAPEATANPPAIVRWLAMFDLGAFGVALFFLISGFVIALSFRHHTRISFLIARALRIWPTYLAAIACILAIRYVSAWYWGASLHVPVWEITANAFLLQDFAGTNSLDLVNWTLALEVQFYLLIAVGYGLLMRYRERVVVYAACVLPFMLTLQWVPGLHLHLTLAAARPGMCLPFMLIGTLFFLRIEGLITRREMASAAAFTLLSVAWCLTKMITPNMALSYIAAFVVFLGLFIVRERIGQNRVLAWLSAISYPLYLVHSIVGYTVLRFVTAGLGLSYPLALAVAITVAVCLATVLHFAVERPSMAMGKRLAARRAPAPSRDASFAPAHAGREDAAGFASTELRSRLQPIA